MEAEEVARAHGWITQEEATATAKARVEELGLEWENYVPPAGWVSTDEITAMVVRRLESRGLSLDQLEQEKERLEYDLRG